MHHTARAKAQTSEYRIAVTVMRYFMIMLISVYLCPGCSSPRTGTIPEVEITPMTGFPDEEPGIAQGVSASYTGIYGGYLYVAGGCNFPETPAAEGGAKRYYKGVYVAKTTNSDKLEWQKAGELPEASAYGVSLSTPKGIVCIGGTGNAGPLKSAYIIRYDAKAGTLHVENLPDMPYPVDNMCGTYNSSTNTIYISGGNAGGCPANKLLTLSLDSSDAGWQEYDPFPGEARLQPVCALFRTTDGAEFCIWGGYAPATATDEACLDAGGYTCIFPQKKWNRIPPPTTRQNREQHLSGATSVQINDSTAIFYGGVNSEIFRTALNREKTIADAIQKGDETRLKNLQAEKKQYMEQPPAWYKFNNKMLLYERQTGKWAEIAQSPYLALAGSSVAATGDTIYCVGGEIKPGIRTPRIIRVVIKPRQAR